MSVSIQPNSAQARVINCNLRLTLHSYLGNKPLETKGKQLPKEVLSGKHKEADLVKHKEDSPVEVLI